jgi:glycine cleavage system H protein
MSELKFSKSHEWVKKSGDVYLIGITDYAAKELGDVVFIELPSAGKELKENESFGVVESVKSVSDLIMPITGKIVEINQDLVKTPELVNSSPFEKAWMLKVSITDNNSLNNLLSESDYKKFISEE